MEWIPIDDLKPNPKNPNHHSNEQVERLAHLIKYQGWRLPIIVSKQSGFIVSGHGRLAAAKKLNLKEVPVSYQDFVDEDQEYAFLVSDNSIAAWAELDLSMVNTDIGMLGPDFDLDLLGIENFVVEPAEKSDGNTNESKTRKLSERFLVPPFTILDTRQGYWQERKREWLALGIKSELGRGGG